MPRIFRENKITSDGVLGYEAFKFFSDASSTEFVPEKLEKIVKRAEGYLETEIPMLPASLYLEFVRIGNRSNYEKLFFRRRDMALVLALAEAYERKGRFTDKALDLVWAIMEESTWTLPAHMYNYPVYDGKGLCGVYGNEGIHGIALFSASTAATLSMIYYLLHEEFDRISPVICKKIDYMLHDRIIKPFLNCSFWWTGERGNVVNNWCPWVCSNVLVVTSVIEKDIFVRKRVVTRVLDALDCFTANYKSDGGCDEGPSYWGAAGAAYFDCLEILYDMSGGAINVYGHPLVKAICEYIVDFNINGARRFINFADCPPTTHHDGIMIRRMGEKCGSETLCAFGDTMASVADGGTDTSHVYRAMRNITTKTPEASVAKAKKKIWFPDLKVMAARSSEDPSKGIFVAMKGGSNAEQHNHNDVGNVVVYYDGNPVLIDTGAGQYTQQTFSNRRYELWFMQSHYHNLPAFGGVGEKEGGRYVSSDEIYDVDTGAVSMQLSKAYLPEAELISYTRKTLLDANATVHITDTVSLEREKEVDFRFMTCAAPAVNADGSITLAEGRTMRYDPRLVLDVEEFEVNDPGIENNWKTKVLWRLHFKASIKDGSFEFTVK